MDTTTVTFTLADGSAHTFNRHDVPKSSMLFTTMNEFPNESSFPLLQGNKTSFAPIAQFIRTRRVAPQVFSADTVGLIEHLMFGGSYPIEAPGLYASAFWVEEYMRKHMYDPVETKFYADQHAGLTELTEELWNNLVANRSRIQASTLFPSAKLVPRSWTEVQTRLAKLKSLLVVDGQVKPLIAGGAVLSSLFVGDTGDVDVFLTLPEVVPQDKAELATAYTKKFLSAAVKAQPMAVGYDSIFIRSAHALTLSTKYNQVMESYQVEVPMPEDPKYLIDVEQIPVKKYLKLKHISSDQVIHQFPDIQVILRAYRSFSEVLHGFDLDASCVGLDVEGRIWVTDRWLHAASFGVNVFSFSRMSPSYSKRLVKYAWKGFAIYLPGSDGKGFDRSTIDPIKVQTVLRSSQNIQAFSYRLDNIYRFFLNPKTGLRNLDALLFLEARFESTKNKVRSERSIRQLAETDSDYSPYFDKRDINSHFNCVDELITNYNGDLGKAETADALQRLLGLTYYDSISLIRIPPLIHPKIKSIFQYAIGVLRLDDLDTYIQLLLEVPSELYQALGMIKPWAFPASVTDSWKITNPGEQFTGTFHPTQANIAEWWCSELLLNAPAAPLQRFVTQTDIKSQGDTDEEE